MWRVKGRALWKHSFQGSHLCKICMKSAASIPALLAGPAQMFGTGAGAALPSAGRLRTPGSRSLRAAGGVWSVMVRHRMG